MAKLVINVTKQDIKAGLQGNPNFCAIARACKRQYGAFGRVNVDGYNVDFQDEIGEVVATFKLSGKAREFISRFDESKSLAKPGVYTAE